MDGRTPLRVDGVFSEYGSDPSWSRYKADIVPAAITFDRNNKIYHNTCIGAFYGAVVRRA